MTEKKRPYKINLIPIEGDLDKMIDEIIQEKIDSVLRDYGPVHYNDGNKSNHTTGVVGNE